jgi:hypothetical protein
VGTRFCARDAAIAPRLILRRWNTTSPLWLMCQALGGNAVPNSMSGILFPWRMELPRSKTYAKRAEECRWLASVSPPEFRHTYLKLAAEYEQLAKATENPTA